MTATNDTQQMGGTDTYSERYIKMKVFQIKDNNLDFDSQDNTKKVSTEPDKPWLNETDEKYKKIVEFMTGDKADIKVVESKFKLSKKLKEIF